MRENRNVLFKKIALLLGIMFTAGICILGEAKLKVNAMEIMENNMSDMKTYVTTSNISRAAAKKKTGLYKENGSWYYYKKGVKQTKYAGLVKNQRNGKYYYVRKGKLKRCTGLVRHTNGCVYYVKKRSEAELYGVYSYILCILRW